MSSVAITRPHGGASASAQLPTSTQGLEASTWASLSNAITLRDPAALSACLQTRQLSANEWQKIGFSLLTSIFSQSKTTNSRASRAIKVACSLIEVLAKVHPALMSSSNGPEGFTPLHMAISMGVPFPVMHALIRNGAELEARDALGRTALTVAISRYPVGYRCLASQLMALGSRADVVDGNMLTVLHYACLRDWKSAETMDLVHAILGWAPASAWGRDRHKQLPLVYAMRGSGGVLQGDGRTMPFPDVQTQPDICRRLAAHLEGRPFEGAEAGQGGGRELSQRMNHLISAVSPTELIAPDAAGLTPFHYAVMESRLEEHMVRGLLDFVGRTVALPTDLVATAVIWGNLHAALLLNSRGFGPFLGTNEGTALVREAIGRLTRSLTQAGQDVTKLLPAPVLPPPPSGTPLNFPPPAHFMAPPLPAPPVTFSPPPGSLPYPFPSPASARPYPPPTSPPPRPQLPPRPVSPAVKSPRSASTPTQAVNRAPVPARPPPSLPLQQPRPQAQPQSVPVQQKGQPSVPPQQQPAPRPAPPPQTPPTAPAQQRPPQLPPPPPPPTQQQQQPARQEPKMQPLVQPAAQPRQEQKSPPQAPPSSPLPAQQPPAVSPTPQPPPASAPPQPQQPQLAQPRQQQAPAAQQPPQGQEPPQQPPQVPAAAPRPPAQQAQQTQPPAQTPAPQQAQPPLVQPPQVQPRQAQPRQIKKKPVDPRLALSSAAQSSGPSGAGKRPLEAGRESRGLGPASAVPMASSAASEQGGKRLKAGEASSAEAMQVSTPAEATPASQAQRATDLPLLPLLLPRQPQDEIEAPDQATDRQDGGPVSSAPIQLAVGPSSHKGRVNPLGEVFSQGEREEQVERLEAEVRRLTEVLELQKEASAQEQGRMQAELEGLRNHVKGLREAGERRRESLESVLQELEKVNQELEASTRGAEWLQRDVADAEQRTREMEGEVGKVREEGERRVRSRVEAVREELGRDLDRLRGREAGLQKRLSDRDADIAELRREVERRRNEARSLQLELRDERRRVDRLQDELDRAKRGRGRSRSAERERERDREQPRDPRLRREEGGGGSSRELAEAHEKIMSLQTQAGLAAGALHEREAEVQRERTALARVMARLDELEVERIELKTDYDALDAWVLSLERQCGVTSRQEVEALLREGMAALAAQRQTVRSPTAGSSSGGFSPSPDASSSRPSQSKAGRGKQPQEPSPKKSDVKEEILELREEVAYWEGLFQQMSLEHHAYKTQVNEAKDFLLELEAMKPGLVPVRTFCEASDEEVDAAYRQHTEANKAFNKRSSKATLDKAIEEIDKALRDSTFDPFLRCNGAIIAVDWEGNGRLKSISKRYGDAMANLVVEKKKEIEVHNPSGCYPIKKLWHADKELSIAEALRQMAQTMHIAVTGTRAAPPVTRARSI